MSKYDHLLDFCETQQQTDAVLACIKHGSNNKAAKALKINRRTIDYRIKQLRLKAAKKGVAPYQGLDRAIPDGFKLKGFSDMRTNSEGKPIWYKVDEDKERQAELMQEAINVLKEDLPVYSQCIYKGHDTSERLLNNFIISDYHLGMLAWGEEAGDDWDLDIAEELLNKWFDAAIAQSPKAKKAVLTNLGDFLHWDGMEAVTPTSGHSLDADSRFQKLVRIAVRLLRSVIDKLLKSHEQVHLVMVTGNHDLASSVWLREIFAHVYSDEPRLTVDLNPDIYYCVEHGDTSLFYHHGHKRKPANITEVIVGKFREVIGRTKYTYCHTGHLHHHESKENAIMVIEQHRTLAAKDAHASQGGYMSGRDAQVITYCSKHGEVSRIKIRPEMVA